MERMVVRHGPNTAVLDRNARYLENISVEEKPIVLSGFDSQRLDECIFVAGKEVFGFSSRMMAEKRKKPREVRARAGMIHVFRALTNYSGREIGQRLNVSAASVLYHMGMSNEAMQVDLRYSARVLTAVIRSYALYYPQNTAPVTIDYLINLAKKKEAALPVLRAA